MLLPGILLQNNKNNSIQELLMSDCLLNFDKVLLSWGRFHCIRVFHFCSDNWTIIFWWNYLRKPIVPACFMRRLALCCKSLQIVWTRKLVKNALWYSKNMLFGPWWCLSWEMGNFRKGKHLKYCFLFKFIPQEWLKINHYHSYWNIDFTYLWHA